MHWVRVAVVLVGAIVVALAVSGVGYGDVSTAEEDDLNATLLIENNGEAMTFGTPTEVNGTLADHFVEGTEGVGAIYVYDGGWELVTDLENTTLEPRDALAVSTTGEGPDEIVVELEFEEFDGDLSGPELPTQPVDQGWNFLTGADCESAENSFMTDPLEDENHGMLVLDRFQGPTTDYRAPIDPFDYYVIGSFEWMDDDPPDVDPFSGYYAYYDTDAEVPYAEDPEALC